MEAGALDKAVEAANTILAGGSAEPKQILDLVKVLHGARKFGLARKVLDRCCTAPAVAADPQLRLKFAQKRALSTYKDPDLQADKRLEDALRILREAEDLRQTTDQETLGLTGAIYKRKWELDGRARDLETSLAYYGRGYRLGSESDYGYNGINAAFVLDLLADLDSPENQAPDSVSNAASQRRAQAGAIRAHLIDVLPGLPDAAGNGWLANTWWFLVTVGEAYFGLGRNEEARAWLNRAAALEGVADWERESTARQLAALLRLRKGSEDERRAAERVLAEFLGNAFAAVASVIRGKVGLAVSGGGFRASLYHIGVLAKLAELDLLRHVEYLSCVSGGSIVGAYYYLEVRKLLQETRDEDVTREHYVRIVQRVAEQFLLGVERNIRTRIAAEWITNFKIMFLPDYSRTMRAGELYETELYSRVKDGEGDAPRWLSSLRIIPKGEPELFAPKDHNWRRQAKVPILVLNATTLNTGHNWQFTASWMGEPPAGIDAEVDANYRLRRMYYEEAPPRHQKMRLGYAVAASACVPGIFEPLPLVDLYERMPDDGDRKVRPVVRLVDGGVHDNQGIAALLEQNCTVLLVSDASGQMSSQDSPSKGLLGVPLRSNSILQSRVRVSQFQDLAGRLRGGLLKGLMFVHLKKDLESTPVDWVDSQDRSIPGRPDPLTTYGVQKNIQRCLAAIRTDLDSFSEAEAYALMADGYVMTEHALAQPILGFEVREAPREEWTFLKVGHLLKQRGEENPLLRQLKVAHGLFFKVWSLMRPLQISLGIIALMLLVLLGYAAYTWWSTRIFSVTVGGAVVAILTTALSLAGFGLLSRALNWRKTVQEVMIGLGMVTIGALLARLHLHVFDRLFLAQGRLARLVGAPASDSKPR